MTIIRSFLSSVDSAGVIYFSSTVIRYFKYCTRKNDVFGVLELSEYVLFHILAEFLVLVLGLSLLGRGP